MADWLGLGILVEIGEAIGNIKHRDSGKRRRVAYYEEAYRERMKNPIRIRLTTERPERQESKWDVVDAKYKVVDQEEDHV